MNIKFKHWLMKRRDALAGQGMTEYALIMASVAVVAYVAYTALGSSIVNEISNVTSSL
jgi:Flp pilus assembly pilin Flp